MLMNIEIKIVPFGQIMLEIGKLTPSEERQTIPVREAVRYREPQETASLIYDVRYEEKLTNYIIPLSTG